MNSQLPREINEIIIAKAKEFGASLAGFADPASLKNSPSYIARKDISFDHNFKVILVLALVHGESEPELDWGARKPYHTPGNRRLIEIGEELSSWLKKEYEIVSENIPYSTGKGGIFLKDAAAIAGLGIIGKNNLLITPEYGPRVRLSAMTINTTISSTEPSEFDPCSDCDMPCKNECPQGAFSEGDYNKTKCNIQMYIDEESIDAIKYCRKCEFSCPVGREI
ncbi:MAG: epoxyqueuosine reductase [Thermoplasmata archaeon]|nr:MAG: epoxyqueuosine reductase [Thermoplasmata archaeon]